MKIYIYNRVGNYEEETYSVVAENEEEAWKIIKAQLRYEISDKWLKGENLIEWNTVEKGIIYINSYSA
jgi:hypothetical protein